MNNFLPHGMCLAWNPSVMALFILSNALIALSYFGIAGMLIFVFKARELRRATGELNLQSFMAFIFWCGLTHVMEIVTLWFPVYWLSGFVHMVTAVVSVGAAVLLAVSLPKIKHLPTLLAESMSLRQMAETQHNNFGEGVLSAKVDGLDGRVTRIERRQDAMATDFATLRTVVNQQSTDLVQIAVKLGVTAHPNRSEEAAPGAYHTNADH